MARTPITIGAASPTSGAVGLPIAIDATNNMVLDLSSPYVLPNIDRYGLWLVVYNSAASTYNCIVRGNSNTLGDLTTAVTNATVAIIGPLPLVRFGMGVVMGGDIGLDIDFSNTLFTGTIMAVAGLQVPIPAATVGVWILKPAPGALLGTVVTTLGTAVQTFLDSISPPSGRTLATIAGSAPVGTMAGALLPANNGIVANSIASGPAVTAFYA